MRWFVVTSLTVLMLMCGANANAGAGGWRDLRIDASSDDSGRLLESAISFVQGGRV